MSVSLRATLAPRAQPGAASIRVRDVARGLGLALPTTVGDILATLEPIELSFRLSSGRISGLVAVTLSSDGLVRFTGRIHDSGAVAAAYVVIVSFPTLTDDTVYPPSVSDLVGALGPVVIPHKGHVGGTASFDTRDSSWDKTAIDLRRASLWGGVRAAAASARVNFGVGTDAIDVADAFANVATGAFVFGL